MTAIKKQLINLVVTLLIEDHESFHEHTRKLIVIGEEAAPVEISSGKITIRQDPATTHEEADNIIVQMAMMCARTNDQYQITVVSDDTDDFILLMHYYYTAKMKNHVIIESPI